ncbi:MAG: hypothetical protein QOE27_1817 [Solirubrobacteraceae bacterium]|nr:hypothetical protein [Solirubrobacteraceae bacterium]
MPPPGKMLRRIGLLVVLLVAWLVLSGPGIPSWLADVGEIGLWFGAALAIYWLVRENLLPLLRARRRP